MDLVKYTKKIDTIIKKYGIPSYVKKWEKINIPLKFNNILDNQMNNKVIQFLNNYVQSYHFHSFIIYNDNNNKSNIRKIKNKLPSFYWDKNNKIGRIKFYSYERSFNKLEEKKNRIEIVNIVKKNYDKWVKNGLSGIIIDLSKHHGGDMNPAIESLYPLLGNTSLFAFTKKKITIKQ